MADIIVDTTVLQRAPQELREVILSKYADTIKNNIRMVAKAEAHVDTGNMRARICNGPTKVVGDRVILTVSSPVVYGAPEEFRKPTKAHPEGHSYMRRAFRLTQNKHERMLARAVEEALK